MYVCEFSFVFFCGFAVFLILGLIARAQIIRTTYFVLQTTTTKSIQYICKIFFAMESMFFLFAIRKPHLLDARNVLHEGTTVASTLVINRTLKIQTLGL